MIILLFLNGKNLEQNANVELTQGEEIGRTFICFVWISLNWEGLMTSKESLSKWEPMGSATCQILLCLVVYLEMAMGLKIRDSMHWVHKSMVGEEN